MPNGTAAGIGPIATNVPEKMLDMAEYVQTYEPGQQAKLFNVLDNYGTWVPEGGAFGVGFRLGLPAGVELPVDFTIPVPEASDTASNLVHPCHVREIEVRIGSEVIRRSEGMTQFTLYPPIFAGVRNVTGADAPSDAVIKISGTAPKKAGIHGSSIECTVESLVTAQHLLDYEPNVPVINKILAFPQITTPLPVGKVSGTENQAGNEGIITWLDALPTSSSAPFQLYGPGNTSHYELVIAATFNEADDNGWDDDYMTAGWNGKERIVIDSVAEYFSNPQFIDESGVWQDCLSVAVYDEDWGRGGSGAANNNDERIGFDVKCWFLQYTQIPNPTEAMLDLTLSLDCNAVLAAVSSTSHAVSAASFLNCKKEWDLSRGAVINPEMLIGVQDHQPIVDPQVLDDERWQGDIMEWEAQEFIPGFYIEGASGADMARYQVPAMDLKQNALALSA